jgi:KaiC/GvpD/RAD55 family RecA-like ATPase
VGDHLASGRAIGELVSLERLESGAEYDLPPGEDHPENLPNEEELGEFFIDWAEFWSRSRLEADWLFDDVLARGRGHAIYAGFKTGKSLFMLWLAVQIALRGVLIVYLDFEMGDDDLYERLADMGYGPETDLSHLHYAVLPSLPALDAPAGAAALFDKVDLVQAGHPEAPLAVVIDTTARAVAGEENSADTYRAFDRFTGLGLKQRGVTWARLDHSGKDRTKGQRGSSAKGDDVDVVWHLTRTDNGISLRRDASRMGWVPAAVAFRQMGDPLRFVQVAEDWPAGTADLAATLDQLGVPTSAGERPAGRALREAGHQGAQHIVRAAQKYRRRAAEEGVR